MIKVDFFGLTFYNLIDFSILKKKKKIALLMLLVRQTCQLIHIENCDVPLSVEKADLKYCFTLAYYEKSLNLTMTAPSLLVQCKIRVMISLLNPKRDQSVKSVRIQCCAAFKIRQKGWLSPTLIMAG